jgi:hypothetical protein
MAWAKAATSASFSVHSSIWRVSWERQRPRWERTHPVSLVIMLVLS